MNSRFIIILIVALVFASIAALIAKSWIGRQVVAEERVTSQVVMAAMEIPYGVKLEPTHVKTIEWAGADVPKGSFQNSDQVIGKISKNRFFAGDMITEPRITEHLGGSTLSSLISENSRAMSIRVDDVVGVSGFVLPGNRVDILVTRTTRQQGRDSAKAKTILENIKVLAVDQEASPDKEKPAVVRAVTLELKPKEAEKLVEAMQEGKIQLVLRNPLDSNSLIEKEVTPVVKVKPKPVVRKKRKPAPAFVVVPW